MFNKEEKYVFGGYIKNKSTRFESTSGGAFSAIVDAYCQEEYAVFGAEANGLEVFHSYVTDKKKIGKYKKSKYSQSKMGDCYKQCEILLKKGKKVLFSGTPCQIAGLKVFLNATNTNTNNLLTVEVVCEGVPSPLYMRKYEEMIRKKYGKKIQSIDYRYTGKSFIGSGRWDFEVMKICLEEKRSSRIFSKSKKHFVHRKKEILKDRWFNPFWSIWIKHLMSRPSCYECRFAMQERTADITLGDLWGVQFYCSELYGNNGGASLVIANNKKGIEVVKIAQNSMYGHELKFEDAIKYQGPIRKHISKNPKRDECIKDLQGEMTIHDINRKWADKPTIKLLWQKYIWGNRQKIFFKRLTRGLYKIK